MKNLRAIRALCLFGGFAFGAVAMPAHAQQPAAMRGMNMSGSAKASGASSSNDSTQAFKAADDRMMHDMSVDYSGNADEDFVAHMIPHHAGAIEMAQVELKYGKDPELKRLARNIVKAQRDEIALMKSWQSKHAAK